MKTAFFNFRRYFFALSFGFGCLAMLLTYQNCSKEVAFESRPSVDRGTFDGSGSPDGTNTVGGNANVVINLNETPADTTVDHGDSVVDFEVTTPDGTITDVRCELDGQQVACNPTDRIPINNPGVGTHTFTIIGTNSGGETGVETVTWTIYNEIYEVEKNIAVNVIGDKVDIIINVDNSGSMEYEQQSMAGRIASFMEKFQHLDYHIAITTTSPIGGAWHSGLDYVDGKFVTLSDGSHCITKDKDSPAQAQQHLRENVVRDIYLEGSSSIPEGNGFEKGIFTTYRAFERSTASGSNANCLRAGVPKHVILISDEDETMREDDGTLINFGSDILHRSSGDNLRAYVASLYPDTIFTFHSIIVNPGTEEGRRCLDVNQGGHGRFVGTLYAALSRDTGGKIGSVCADDYSTQLGQIGQLISDSALTYPLECVAIANSNGDWGGVTNDANGQAVSVGFRFNGDKIEFENELSQGDYTVKHYCYR
ncbi:MAG: hypothetical protein KDD33_03035 [Bdellovibrionales bacterium]|nr:hypothetical protein [Bdellovibrionales bacterium]